MFVLLLIAALVADDGKFLLAARKFRRPTCTDYIISLDADDMSRESNAYVGKLRSTLNQILLLAILLFLFLSAKTNPLSSHFIRLLFLGTKFTIYDRKSCSTELVVNSKLIFNVKKLFHWAIFGNQVGCFTRKWTCWTARGWSHPPIWKNWEGLVYNGLPVPYLSISSICNLPQQLRYHSCLRMMHVWTGIHLKTQTL